MLIKNEISELREMLSKYNNGLLSETKVMTKLSIYSEIAKRVHLILKAYALAYQTKTMYPDAQKVITDLLSDPVKTEDLKDETYKDEIGSPCLACEHRDEDKNSSVCMNCEERIEYCRILEAS